MTSINVPVRLTAASLAAVFALAACSSSEDAGSADGSVEPVENDDSSGVFDFTESSMGPVESIEFRIPDELVDLTDGYAKTRVFESITVSATEIEGSSNCGVEYQFEYVEGGFERLEKYFDYEESKDNSREDSMAFHFLNVNVDALEINEDFTSAVRSVRCASSPSDADRTAIVKFPRIISPDGREDFWVLASSEFTVMQNGDLFVHNPEVDGFQLDSNGSWLKV